MRLDLDRIRSAMEGGSSWYLVPAPYPGRQQPECGRGMSASSGRQPCGHLPTVDSRQEHCGYGRDRSTKLIWRTFCRQSLRDELKMLCPSTICRNQAEEDRRGQTE